MSGASSGTHRIGRRTPPSRVEIPAPELLDRDVLCSILAEYVARANSSSFRSAARSVREELEALGTATHLNDERRVPQPLAGQLVLGLARRLDDADQRAEFLSHAWLVLHRSLRW